jgi:hypothetical protein
LLAQARIVACTKAPVGHFAVVICLSASLRLRLACATLKLPHDAADLPRIEPLRNWKFGAYSIRM